jgi:hypothetical protein
MTYSRYRHLAIERARPAPTDTQLAAIENLLGARLPASFRDFLRVANGGYLEYVVDVRMGSGKTEPLCFCGLFSADEGTFCDGTFVGEIRSAREYVKIPQGVLPFARDGGGSVVYLDLSLEGNGRVVAFVTGLPEWTGLRTESGFIYRAGVVLRRVRCKAADRPRYGYRPVVGRREQPVARRCNGGVARYRHAALA